MEYDIFISYSREDSDIVKKFADHLTDLGYGICIDINEAEPSNQLEKRVAEAIMNSAVFLFFYTTSYNESDSIIELYYALNKNKRIIPIHLDSSDFEESIKDDIIDIDYINYTGFNSTMRKIISFLMDYIDKCPPSITINPALTEKSSEELFKLGKACYDNKEYEQAIKYYELAAKQGHSGAQYSLGCCYDSGEGVEIDELEAARWYRKAAKQGHVWAQFNLGCCYDVGEGVCQSPQEAARWYRLAAEQGFADAQYNLGDCYDFGNGVPQDYKEALRWYLKAANQGHLQAQVQLWIFYETGRGVTQNYETAFFWCRKVAEQGNAEAQYFLGLYYESGIAVTKDIGEAVLWYRKAAGQGYYSAIKKLEQLGLQ